MPDPYASITEADPAVVTRLADVLEIRAAEPQQRAMLDRYLADIPFRPGARILEVGCGTGAISRVLAELPEAAEVIGLDPSPILLERASVLGANLPKLSFQQGDGRNVPFADANFDAVVFHTSLCHIPDCERALSEASRVLRPGGQLAIFDGDYASTSVAIGDNDPLQTCVALAVANFVHDPWLARRLSRLVRRAGFVETSFRSHGFVQTTDPTYVLTLIDRGADLQVATGLADTEFGESLKSAARRRLAEGRFYGQIVYVSLVAHRPTTVDA